ncbi:three-Cys-motif partner protein TcmP [Baaleninema sp.]|uniref:three-Cys-motif partner protein TcmP n=1 Tax=Baaleninema sp. TaxID=3101197 RepID=UPI003D03CE69
MNKQLSLFDNDPNAQRDFFTRKREWSVAKHRIILKYLQASCYNLAALSDTINYIDGFAGSGEYEEGAIGGIEEFIKNSPFWKRYEPNFSDKDGSPIIALKTSRILQAEQRVNLRCFFVEENRERNQKLRDKCSAVGEGLGYKIYPPSGFEEILDNLMVDLGQGLSKPCPSLFFLDTFSPNGVGFESLKRIAEYQINFGGELFILFHNGYLSRQVGNAMSEKWKQQGKTTGDTFAKKVDSFFGASSKKAWRQKWEEIKRTDSPPQTFAKWAIEHYKQKLRDECSFKGVVSFEIKEEFNSVAPKYHIIACSRHPEKAFGVLLNDLVYEENKSLFFRDNFNQNLSEFLEQDWQRENQDQLKILKPHITRILADICSEWTLLDDAMTRLILTLDREGILSMGKLKRKQYRSEVFIPLYQKGILEAETVGKQGLPRLTDRVRVR